MNGEVPETVMDSPAKGDDVGAIPTLSSRVLALAKKGWSIRIEMDWFGSFAVSGFAGDCNCPYRKEYDPSDGHGTSEFDSDDRYNEKSAHYQKAPKTIGSLEGAVDYAEAAVAAIVPGAPW